LVAVEAMRNHHATDREAKARVETEFQKDLLPWDMVSGKVDKSHPLYDYVTKNGVTADQLEQLRKNAITQDLFGVNFYPWSSTRYWFENGEIKSAPGPDDGRQLADVMTKCYPHIRRPLFVTETSATGDFNRRALWMAETIDAIIRARMKGVPVVGYTWFPLITMVEWEYRTDTKPIQEHLLHLGLWDSRFDDKGVLVREPTPLVETYKDWIRRDIVERRGILLPPVPTE
jgi:beta-glucosidase